MLMVVTEHALPQLAFGSADIEAMGKEFRTSAAFRAILARWQRKGRVIVAR